MNSVRTGSLIVFLVVLVLFGMSMAFGKTPGHGHHGDRGAQYGNTHHEDHFFMIINRLNLARDQKQQLASLLKDHREQARQYVRDMIKAKKELIEAMMAEPYDQGAVDRALREVFAAKEEIVHLKAEVLQSMRKDILTPEQNASLDKMKQEMFTKMDSMMDAHFAHMDAWINEYIK